MIINGESHKVLRDKDGNSQLREWWISGINAGGLFSVALREGHYIGQRYLFTSENYSEALDIAIECLFPERTYNELRSQFGMTDTEMQASWEAGEFCMTGQGVQYHNDEAQDVMLTFVAGHDRG